MEKFRFAVMGAGNIAVNFCRAAALIPDCEVAAVASKSGERAAAFAARNGIGASFGSYDEMLEKIKPDCVYIAVTPNDHHRLCMLCLEKGVPVLCEKAFVMNSAQAGEIFELSRKKGIFVMEALWSRFLPAVRKARTWIEEGRIGHPGAAAVQIGFVAPADGKNRYLNKKLGGGAAFDLTVYTYELADFFLNRKPEDIQVSVLWGPTGVDLTDQVTVRYADCMAVLTSSFAVDLDDKAVIFGDRGRIVVPNPHYAGEAYLYPAQGGEEIFRDRETENGFVYEIRETMDCIRAGLVESPVVPHSLTLSCAEVFDRILATGRTEKTY